LCLLCESSPRTPSHLFRNLRAHSFVSVLNATTLCCVGATRRSCGMDLHLFFVRSRRSEVRSMRKTAARKYEVGIQVEKLLPPSDASSDEPRVLGENGIRLPEYSHEVGLPFPNRRSLTEDELRKMEPEEWLRAIDPYGDFAHCGDYKGLHIPSYDDRLRHVRFEPEEESNMLSTVQTRHLIESAAKRQYCRDLNCGRNGICTTYNAKFWQPKSYR
jgi:hypothetical protein